MKSWWHEQRVPRAGLRDLADKAGCPEGKSVEHWLQAEAETPPKSKVSNRKSLLEREGAV